MLAERHPFIRRIVRLIMLPYCFVQSVPWDICTRNRLLVFFDFLFIFFWLKYLPNNYGPCRFWEKKRHEWTYYYGSIYEPYQRSRLRKIVQPGPYRIIFDDKEICSHFLTRYNIKVPYEYGIIVPEENYNKRIRSYFMEGRSTELILKPCDGKGGEGISLVYSLADKNDIMVKSSSEECKLDDFFLKRKSLLQEFIKQNNDIERIYSASVNTVRIVTLLTKEKQVLILGALMRFGNNGSFVDNVSAGGIAVGINLSSGIFFDNGFNSSGHSYIFHPFSKFRFSGFKVPYWKEILEMSKNIQRSFNFYKLLGVDIAVQNDGPLLIEINSSPDIVGLERCCGPILKNSDVYSAFKEYGLLINDLQENIS